MAALQARLEYTIDAMKRSLARNDDNYDADGPIDHPTNRGNKLKYGAEDVQEGRLNNGRGSRIRVEKVNHAGYERNVIYRNAPRYDHDGDVILEDDADDEDADYSADEDNIYAGIKLENLLGPLTAASDLPTHPAMSHAYTSKALDELIDQISKTLRREQKNVVKMKSLLTTLRGDPAWAPCGSFETDYDSMVLQGRWPDQTNHEQPPIIETPVGGVRDLWTGDGLSAAAMATAGNGTSANLDGDGDVDMVNRSAQVESDNAQEQTNGARRGDAADVGTSAAINGSVRPSVIESAEAASDEFAQPNGNPIRNDGASTNGAVEGEGEEDDAASIPLSHRMTTRAQANKQSEESSPMLFVDEEVPPIHPIFLFPTPGQADADFGLPPQEAEQLRRDLASYVPRQEAVVRCFAELLDRLLEADRMRKNVFKWAKAEAHVGEMSDGEDWYDMEEWGLEQPLKKGEEEPDEEANNPAKKTRQRRAER